MATTATFLHVTDTHLKPGGLSNQEDLKLDVPGIGPATRKKLLRKFGSVRGVAAATEAELTEVVNAALAAKIRAHLASEA